MKIIISIIAIIIYLFFLILFLRLMILAYRSGETPKRFYNKYAYQEFTENSAKQSSNPSDYWVGILFYLMAALSMIYCIIKTLVNLFQS